MVILGSFAVSWSIFMAFHFPDYGQKMDFLIFFIVLQGHLSIFFHLLILLLLYLFFCLLLVTIHIFYYPFPGSSREESVKAVVPCLLANLLFCSI